MTHTLEELIPDYIQGLPAYVPGKPVEEVEQDLKIHAVKLASNEGPFGPLPAAMAAFEAAALELNRYPDAGTVRLRDELARRFAVQAEQIVVGNGADELIRFAALATLDPGERAVYPWPSFQSYPTAVAAAAGESTAVPLLDRALDFDVVATRRQTVEI